MERVFAQNVKPVDIASIFSPARSIPDVGTFVSTILTNSIAFAAVIAFVFIIVGGFGIIAGAGDSDPKRIEQGRKTLTMAVVGLLVIVFSLWFMQALRYFLGFDPLKPEGI